MGNEIHGSPESDRTHNINVPAKLVQCLWLLRGSGGSLSLRENLGIKILVGEF